MGFFQALAAPFGDPRQVGWGPRNPPDCRDHKCLDQGHTAVRIGLMLIRAGNETPCLADYKVPHSMGLNGVFLPSLAARHASLGAPSSRGQTLPNHGG